MSPVKKCLILIKALKRNPTKTRKIEGKIRKLQKIMGWPERDYIEERLTKACLIWK